MMGSDNAGEVFFEDLLMDGKLKADSDYILVRSADDPHDNNASVMLTQKLASHDWTNIYVNLAKQPGNKDHR